MKILHIVPELNEANGVFVVARLLARESGDAAVVGLDEGLRRIGDGDVEEVWVHGMWLPREWAACRRVLKAGKRLVRMTHGSLSPIYLKYQSSFKKRLVGPIERWVLRRCAKIVATCEAEKEWIEAYLGKRCPKVEVTDVKRFFDLNHVDHVEHVEGRALHLLYLGRRHPLKGLEYLEQAVKGIEGVELRIVSNAFGEEKEKVWDWCDVLILPTLSENFGLVVAEALERGKRVITTDGAPAWEDLTEAQGIYLKGFRDGSDEIRVKLLKDALTQFVE